MEVLCTTSRNIRHYVVDGKIVPEIEAILTVTAKTHQPDGSRSEYQTVRFTLHPEAARQLAQSLGEWADQAEEEAEKLTWTGD